jgi:hypothetical protein
LPPAVPLLPECMTDDELLEILRKRGVVVPHAKRPRSASSKTDSDDAAES